MFYRSRMPGCLAAVSLFLLPMCAPNSGVQEPPADTALATDLDILDTAGTTPPDDTGGDTGQGADADTDADTDSDTDTDVDADTDSDTDTDVDADTDSDTDTDADADTDSAPDTDTHTSADTGAGAGTDSETGDLCSSGFAVSATLSPVIPTVGIVEWSTTEAVSSARVQFGQDTDYEHTAPVDIDGSSARALLLGMKPSTTYHYRIIVESQGQTCMSDDRTIGTGAQAVDLPSIVVADEQPGTLSGDFLITTSSGYAIILDGDGDFVWWYRLGRAGGGMIEEVSRVHMSYDGKLMWAMNINMSGGFGQLHRISMDGSGAVETITTDSHHDFCVLPDNGIAYIEFDRNGEQDTCDRIVERSATGETRAVYALRDDFAALAPDSGEAGGEEWCHSNAIHYVPSQDAYYVSVLNQSMIIKVNRSSGRLEWAIDGDGNTVDGVTYLSGATWSRQHGLHALENGNLLVFNNGEGGFGGEGNSYALELRLDEEAGTAVEVWRYDGGASTPTLGDVQQLSNGNVAVVYSNRGLIHEVPPGGEAPIRTITARGFGYLDARRSLYGPPDRY